jgi:hypothetical protein
MGICNRIAKSFGSFICALSKAIEKGLCHPETSKSIDNDDEENESENEFK